MNFKNILGLTSLPVTGIALSLLLSTQPATAQKNKGNNQDNSKGKNNKSNTKALPAELRDKADKAFFEGLDALLKNNFSGAETAFKNCLSIDSQNDAAMYQLARMYLSTDQKESAQDYIEKAMKISPDNKWHLMLYAEVLNQREDYAAAALAYRKMITNNPRDIESYLNLTDAYLKAQKLPEALSTLDELEKIIGVTEEISQQKEQLYIRMNMPEKAMQEIQKLIDNNPVEPQNYLRLAELYKANNMPDKALDIYQQLLKVSPSDPTAKMAMADHYRSKGDEKRYFEELRQVVDSPQIPLNTKIVALEPYIGKEEADTAARHRIFSMVESLVKVHKTEAMAHILYADLLNTYNRPAQSLAEFEEANKLDNNRFEVWQQILWLQYQLGKYSEMQQKSKEAIQIFPEQAIFYYLDGLANNALQKYEPAIKSLKKATVMTSGNNKLNSQIQGALGDAYHSQKDYENSDAAYEKALDRNPQNTAVLNNYSYYLSLRNEKLDKAAQMAAKANELDPDNPSNIDTYAWVLFKQKKYTEAKQWLEKAIQLDAGKNGTIVEHYGDVLFHLGDTNAALENWQKAKKAGDASNKIDQKIRDKKFYE